MHSAQRETAILAAVIERYISTGSPVPSGVVSGAARLRLSPASIRNAMSVLTEKGYLEQPHVSAGRIPTAKALRLYVDTLLRPRPLSNAKKEAIAAALSPDDADISLILRRAGGVIAGQCMQLGVVLAPRRDVFHWRSIEFSTAGPGLVLAVLILDGGLVRTRMVSVPREYGADELTRFSNYLNSHFRGLTLSDARNRIMHELEQAGEDLEEIRRKALALSRQAVELTDEDRELFVEGAGQVSHSTSFTDAKRLRELLALLEERPRLLDLLDRTMQSPDLSVSFFQNESDAAPWAVVSAPYAPPRGDGRPAGVVSAIGLLHMDYAAVLPVVGHIAASLAGVLRRRLSGQDRPDPTDASQE